MRFAPCPYAPLAARPGKRMGEARSGARLVLIPPTDRPKLPLLLNLERTMRSLVEWTDTRGGYGTQVSWQKPVIDEDTGKTVGFVKAERSPITRHISLFGGKYQGDFTDHEECVAFAKGVEAVLNHMLAADEERIASEQAA
jgi:hypothetical protein